MATKDERLYEQLYNLKNFGIRGEELIVGVGANAKMNEFSAAMGLCNLNHVENNIWKRKQKVDYYCKRLSKVKDVILNKYNQEGVQYNYAYFPIRFMNKTDRDRVFQALRMKNIYSRKYFSPLTSDAACFKNKYRDLPLNNARQVADTVLVLPLYPELKMEEIDFIVDEIIEGLKDE